MKTRKVKTTLSARDIVLEFKPSGQIKSVEGMGPKWVRTVATDQYLMANVELEELPAALPDDKPKKKTRRAKSADSAPDNEENRDAQSL